MSDESAPPPVASAPAAPAAHESLAEKARRIESERARLLEEGRALLESDPAAAHARFEQAYRLNLNDLRAMSHYGMTLVLVEGDRQRGIRFCEEAVRRIPPTREALVNLARALVQTRNREQAVRALKKALELSPEDPEVRQAFTELGLRRPAPIPWLPRNFFLNRWIGKLTWKHRVTAPGGQR